MTKGAAVVERRCTGKPVCVRSRAEATDGQLLDRFVVDGEQEAFAALVQRHGPLVMRVCRGVLRDAHAAEDVFQTTFLVLARKAPVIAWEDSIERWLATAAHRLALKARARAARRRLHECPAADVEERLNPRDDPMREVARREVRGLLDREVGGLPEKYRAPMVLCYFEGKTNEEAARELGWPMGSMSRRLSRARALLLQRLSVRGVALSLGLVAVVAAAWWALPGTPRGPQPGRESIQALMQPFQPVEAGGQGIANALQALAREDDPGIPTEQLAALASQTAAVAERLERLDPGRHPAEWQRHANDMKQSARELAEALRTQEPAATYQSARRLIARCTQCHESFGE